MKARKTLRIENIETHAKAARHHLDWPVYSAHREEHGRDLRLILGVLEVLGARDHVDSYEITELSLLIERFERYETKSEN